MHARVAEQSSRLRNLLLAVLAVSVLLGMYIREIRRANFYLYGMCEIVLCGFTLFWG